MHIVTIGTDTAGHSTRTLGSKPRPLPHHIPFRDSMGGWIFLEVSPMLLSGRQPQQIPARWVRPNYDPGATPSMTRLLPRHSPSWTRTGWLCLGAAQSRARPARRIGSSWPAPDRLWSALPQQLPHISSKTLRSLIRWKSWLSSLIRPISAPGTASHYWPLAVT